MDWKAKLAVLFAGGYGGIKNNILMPLLGRVSGWITVWLMAHMGAPEETAQVVAMGVSGFGVICFELLWSWVNRKAVVRKEVAKTITRVGLSVS